MAKQKSESVAFAAAVILTPVTALLVGSAVAGWVGTIVAESLPVGLGIFSVPFILLGLPAIIYNWIVSTLLGVTLYHWPFHGDSAPLSAWLKLIWPLIPLTALAWYLELERLPIPRFMIPIIAFLFSTEGAGTTNQHTGQTRNKRAAKKAAQAAEEAATRAEKAAELDRLLGELERTEYELKERRRSS